MDFQRYGTAALLINFEQKIEETIHQQVINLYRVIRLVKLDFITFTIPAYCSLTVGYDDTVMDFDTLCLIIENLQKEANSKESVHEKTKHWRIPVCYDEAYGLDLSFLAEEKKITPKEIIQLHSSTDYRVYMLGFLPGFPYMGKLPDALVCERKKNPRLRVPALSVGLAGWQTGIYPSEAPGGWQIIGRTPIPIFDIEKAFPFLFQTGDNITFYPINQQDYTLLSKDIAAQTFNWTSLYE